MPVVFFIPGIFRGIFLLIIAFGLPVGLPAQALRFTPAGGLNPDPQQITISSTTPNTILYYSLDGTEPDTNALLYTQPILVNSTTVLRTRAFAAGLNVSPVVTQSYFIGVQHSFPVVSLAFPPPAFFDSLTGIYTNYSNGQDAVANLEFFENGGDTAVLNQLVEVEIQGTSSVVQPQKSLEIKAKKSLGLAELHFLLFPELPFESYKRFVLRNGGQDWCILQFRDELATRLVGDLSDLGGILKPPKLLL